MTYHIDIQHACHNPAPVDDAMLTLWAETTLQSFRPAGEITLRLVEPEEIAALNHTYRQQNKPTNVLAFPHAVAGCSANGLSAIGRCTHLPQCFSNRGESEKITGTLGTYCHTWCVTYIRLRSHPIRGCAHYGRARSHVTG